jgi:hypothetical protein
MYIIDRIGVIIESFILKFNLWGFVASATVVIMLVLGILLFLKSRNSIYKACSQIDRTEP